MTLFPWSGSKWVFWDACFPPVPHSQAHGLAIQEEEVKSRNRSLWTLGAILPIIITLCTDTILPKAMRKELLLLALLFSSLGSLDKAPSPRLLPRTIRSPCRHNQAYLKNNEPVDVDSEIHLGFKIEFLR